VSDTTPEDPEQQTGPPTTKPRRSAKEIAVELWHQKPGARAQQKPSAPIITKEIVNGLDRREITIGASLAGLDLLFAVLGYFGYRHANTATLRADAWPFFGASVVGAAILALGVVLRRRALLGFACFLVGLEFMSYHFVYGALLFLGVGGWLIFRVTQKQKQDRAAGRPSSSIDTRPTARTSGPKPSKRYTPPRRASSGRRR
jgi:hypothetical protein